MLTVERAAILALDGKVWSVPRPGRHHDVIRVMKQEGYDTPIQGEQGFLLSDGRFARRTSALTVARRANQLIRKTNPQHMLFSEDVW